MLDEEILGKESIRPLKRVECGMLDREPTPAGYGSVDRSENDATITLAAFADIAVPIERFLHRD